MKCTKRAVYIAAAVLLGTLIHLAAFPFANVQASTQTITLRPNSTITGGWSTTGGTANSGCTGHCSYVNESTPDGDGSYLQNSSAANIEEYGLQDVTGGQTATQVVVRAYVERSAQGLLNNQDKIGLNLRVGGTLLGVQQTTVTAGTGTYAWYTATYTGTWTQAQVDGMQAQITKTVTGGLGLLPDTFRLSTVEAQVTWRSPDQNEASNRIYANADSVTPGAPLSAQNTVTDVQQNTPFRVRTGMDVSDYNWNTGTWGTHSNTYVLQYVQKSAATCAAQSTGWSNVSAGTGAIQWYDNPSVADGANITSYGSDPTTAGTRVYQTYKESNPFTNSTPLAIGNNALWDFSLTNAGSITPGTKFCLRIYKSDGTALASYASYPEIVITKDFGVGVVDSSGADVVSPLVSFPTNTVSTTQCLLSSATLGATTQKIRINNDLITNGWNTAIAATNGPTTLWTSGTLHYDFNDPTGATPGCNDGGDSDAYAGQLRVNPSGATLTPKSGCTTTGVSKGIDAKFSEGATNSITLAAADATSSRFCYWDMTGIALEQRIPSQVPAGSYSLDMTITMTAL